MNKIEDIKNYEMNKAKFAELIGLDSANILREQKLGHVTKGNTICLDQVTSYIDYLKTKQKDKKVKTKDITKIDELKRVKLEQEIKNLELKNDNKVNEIFIDAYWAVAELIQKDLSMVRDAIKNNNGKNVIEVIDDTLIKIKKSEPKRIEDNDK